MFWGKRGLCKSKSDLVRVTKEAPDIKIFHTEFQEFVFFLITNLKLSKQNINKNIYQLFIGIK